MSKVWRERKPTRCNNQMFIINFCLNMFQASLCPSSCVLMHWCTALVLLDVVGSGCGAQHPTTATNHIQQNQRSTPYAVTHGFCSPEDGHTDARNHIETEVNNKHLIVASCWFFSLHTLLTMHGHRNLKNTTFSTRRKIAMKDNKQII